MKLRTALLAGGLLLGCAVAIGLAATGSRQSRLSGAVAFPSASEAHRAFLAKPAIGYVQAYLRFEPDFPDDVIMFVDQELLEGLERPRWVSGGDWMAFVGVQRAGGVWVGAGTDATRRGEPSKDRAWEIYDLKQRLKADTWYRMRVVADFGQRRFVSFTIQGGGLDRTIDLSRHQLDYPNHMPFDRASMIYIVGAMRGRPMMREEGNPILYIDDVEGGVLRPDGTEEVLFRDGFDGQTEVRAQPLTLPSIKLDRYTTGRWYLERDESLFRIEPRPFARSGSHVGVADTNLRR